MTKLEALRLTINELSGRRTQYDWHSNSKCNCGIVARCALDLTQSELRKRLPSHGTWTEMIEQKCSVSGRTRSKLLKDLFEVGFTRHDLFHLEYLSDPDIVAEMHAVQQPVPRKWWQSKKKPEQISYRNLRDFFAYIQAWVRILEREEAARPIVSDTTINQDGNIEYAKEIHE